MLKRLLNIRLSYYYPTLFILFFVLLGVLERQKLTPGQLALYSVNSFLFGFYFSPILNAQKTRVDSMNKTVRQEEMVMLDILAQSHLLKPAVRHDLKVRMKAYLNSIIDNPNVRADNPYYDELLHFTKKPEFKDNSVMDTIYGRVSKTQENRDALQSLMTAGVYSHEWLVVSVLFGITVYFVMQTDYNNVLFFRVILAVLCTGLAMMMVILLKYATLTHKQAKQLWNPLKSLEKEHFDDVTRQETAEITMMIQQKTD